ncbi:hypothetical protein QWZ14_29225 [Paeniroseomonas aquatica]|uniref:Uncharacterized protein n=2 Tax=Paeniroseomonas aquatica TaxID=373043 RepID=A0ABT8AFC0_9PROT|nr:hypothetical protein [Paeniroseomonas aquatica]MDN3568479.1 hypothetical protein [Paeniroseomonas aquatica]
MSILNKNEKLGSTLIELCGYHADKFARRQSLHPKRLVLLNKIYRILDKESPVIIMLGQCAQSNAIFNNLNLRTLGIQTILHQAKLVLEIPDERDVYKLGSDRQTIRRMIRKATALKIRCRSVSEPDERQKILQMAIAYEQSHPDERYRKKHPVVPDPNGMDLWLAAFADDLRPIAVSVTPSAGNVATLRFFVR